MRSFTPEQVIQIRERYAQGDVSHMKLADMYATESPVIGAICRGDTYAEIGGPRTAPGKRARVVHLQNAKGNARCGAQAYAKHVVLATVREDVTCTRCLTRRCP